MWGVFVKLVRQYLPFLTPNSALLFIIMWGSLPVVLLCACGDPEAKGVLGGLTRFVTLTAPATLRSTIRYTRVGAYLWDGVGHTLYWFAFRPHPVVQILYLILVVGAYGAFAVSGFPHLSPWNLYMGRAHIAGGTAAMVACLVTFWFASFTNPGIVTPGNVARLKSVFPPDECLFVSGTSPCSTCNLPKVARSKHCRVCDVCVSRFDHHVRVEFKRGWREVGLPSRIRSPLSPPPIRSASG